MPGPDSISVQTISEFPVQKERKKERKKKGWMDDKEAPKDLNRSAPARPEECVERSVHGRLQGNNMEFLYSFKKSTVCL